MQLTVKFGIFASIATLAPATLSNDILDEKLPKLMTLEMEVRVEDGFVGDETDGDEDASVVVNMMVEEEVTDTEVALASTLAVAEDPASLVMAVPTVPIGAVVEDGVALLVVKAMKSLPSSSLLLHQHSTPFPSSAHFS